MGFNVDLMGFTGISWLIQWDSVGLNVDLTRFNGI